MLHAPSLVASSRGLGVCVEWVKAAKCCHAVWTPQFPVATTASVPGWVGGTTTIGRVALVLTISGVLHYAQQFGPLVHVVHPSTALDPHSATDLGHRHRKPPRRVR